MNILFKFANSLWIRCFFLFLAPNAIFAQDYQLEVFPADSSSKIILQKENTPKPFSDSLACRHYLKSFIQTQRNKGFFTASFDTLIFHSKKCQAYFWAGQKYKNIQIHQGNLSAEWMTKLKEKSFPMKCTPSKLKSLIYGILDVCQNHGYPFASIYLDSIQFVAHEFKASIHLDSAHLILLDSAIFRSDKTLKTNFLNRILKIQKGKPFNQQVLIDLEQKIRKLPYLTLTSSAQVIFTAFKAHPLFFVKKKRINAFHGVIGFLPNASKSDRKLRVIGNLNLKLHNAFGRGILIHIALQLPKARSRVLDAEFEYPDVARTNLDFNFKIKLFAEDTLFANWQQKYMMRYDAGNDRKIGLFWSRNTATPTDSVFSLRNERIRISKTNYSAYGINYFQDKRDKWFAPQRGFLFSFQVMFGNKNTLTQKPSSTEQTYKKSTQWVFKTQLKKFFKTGRQTTFILNTKGGWMLNKKLFINELFRLGGFQNLRGFNENAFFAARYWLTTLEYRLYFSKNSSLFTFLDIGLMDYHINQRKYVDKPYGLGTGFMLNTKNGIFNFAYAIGKSKTQQMSMKQSKIHFGYVNQF